MKRILLAWIGLTDLGAPSRSGESDVGPIAQALKQRQFDEIRLLGNTPDPGCADYLAWLRGRTETPIVFRKVKLTTPTDFGEIHNAAVEACETALASHRREDVRLTFHLSPGTPAMAAVWVILGKTRFPAELLETSRERGAKTASVPFEIAAEFVPETLVVADQQLRYGAAAEPPPTSGFEDILHRSPEMARVVALARRVARRDVPVLIEGESGTGKELFARAIHGASPRSEAEFRAINCGAIPRDLLESELFGHRKGAFTGAEERVGYFEAVEGGTLFLDEIGELPLYAQVKLLRVLQEGQVVRLGETAPRKVNVRIVAATNRSLAAEVAASRFREDLFYRLAVALLVLPPLRERRGDISLLLDKLFEQVNREFARDPDYQPKSLSPGARQIFLSHPWPGNVREMLNTIRRAVIWSHGDVIDKVEARESLLPRFSASGENRWERPLGEDFDLSSLMGELAREYLQRAYREAGGNKTKAAKLVGLKSQQTFSNWMKNYGVGGDEE